MAKKKANAVPNDEIQTRKRLLLAAFDEFNEKGYFLANADAITKRAGMAHGTFYIYFKGKNEIFKELLHTLTEQGAFTPYKEEARSFHEHVQNRESLEAAILGYIKPMEDISGLLRAFMQGLLQDPSLFEYARRRAVHFSKMFKPVIDAGQKEGWLGGLDSRILSEIMAISLMSAILLMVTNITEHAPEEIAQGLSAILAPSLIHNPQAPRAPKIRITIAENSIKIRRDLQAAAQAEFIERGYFDTTVTGITKRSGYSRGTFYLYYKDKDDLLSAIVLDVLGQIDPRVKFSSSLLETMDTRSPESLAELVTHVVSVMDTPLNWPALQGFINSPKLGALYKTIYQDFSVPLSSKIAARYTPEKAPGINPGLCSALLLAMGSFSAFLFNAGYVQCSKRKFAVNLTALMHAFFNYPDGQE